MLATLLLPTAAIRLWFKSQRNAPKMLIEFEIGLIVSSFIRFVLWRFFPQDYSKGSFQLNFAILQVMHASFWLAEKITQYSFSLSEAKSKPGMACAHALFPRLTAIGSFDCQLLLWLAKVTALNVYILNRPFLYSCDQRNRLVASFRRSDRGVGELREIADAES